MIKSIPFLVSILVSASVQAAQISCGGGYGSLMGDTNQVALTAQVTSSLEISDVRLVFKSSGISANDPAALRYDATYKPRKYVGYNRFFGKGQGFTYALLLPNDVLTRPKFEAIVQMNVDTGADNNDTGTARLNCTLK